eukprot:scaffold7671_cov104-Isochrysis_galbana.AAC.4
MSERSWRGSRRRGSRLRRVWRRWCEDSRRRRRDGRPRPCRRGRTGRNAPGGIALYACVRRNTNKRRRPLPLPRLGCGRVGCNHLRCRPHRCQVLATRISGPRCAGRIGRFGISSAAGGPVSRLLPRWRCRRLLLLLLQPFFGLLGAPGRQNVRAIHERVRRLPRGIILRPSLPLDQEFFALLGDDALHLVLHLLHRPDLALALVPGGLDASLRPLAHADEVHARHRPAGTAGQRRRAGAARESDNGLFLA